MPRPNWQPGGCSALPERAMHRRGLILGAVALTVLAWGVERWRGRAGGA